MKNNLSKDTNFCLLGQQTKTTTATKRNSFWSTQPQHHATSVGFVTLVTEAAFCYKWLSGRKLYKTSNRKSSDRKPSRLTYPVCVSESFTEGHTATQPQRWKLCNWAVLCLGTNETMCSVSSSFRLMLTKANRSQVHLCFMDGMEWTGMEFLYNNF